MFRRIVPTPCARTSSLGKVATRTYFYPGAGESGIYASTMRTYCNGVLVMVAVNCLFAYKVMFHGTWDSSRQYAPFATDRETDDGTVMTGEEAVANLRIHHDRIMPFMDEMKAKIDNAAGGGGDSHDAPAKHGGGHH